jgi:RNA polymerase sigma-70 factor (ECF subfamily)
VREISLEGEVPGVEPDVRRGAVDEASAEAAADRECIVRVRAGETERFSVLVERYTTRIFTHLFRLVRNREEAEDLTQETFSKAYRSLERLDTARPVRNWLYAIATNAGLNALRAQRRRPTAFSLDDTTELAASAMREPVARGEDARQRVARDDLEQRVAASVCRLPPRSAALVHLHYYEGLTIREASDIAGMTENAAKVALHRARQHLREWLIDGDEDHGGDLREDEQ